MDRVVQQHIVSPHYGEIAVDESCSENDSLLCDGEIGIQMAVGVIGIGFKQSSQSYVVIFEKQRICNLSL